jgi:5S rRNA maturation endonuclease (ribonuclease M5)
MIRRYLTSIPSDSEDLRGGPKPARNGLSAADLERAERLREVLEALREVNRLVPVIVEGRKDASALRRLGLDGEIITLHRGKSIYDFCEDIADRYGRVVILLDWDHKGEQLSQDLQGRLKGHWEEFSPFRDLLRILCQKEVKDIEGIPKLLMRLEGPAGPGHRRREAEGEGPRGERRG